MPATTTTPRSDRWLLLLVVTLGLNLGSLFLGMILIPRITGALASQALIISSVPVIWGLSALFLYRSKREKYVARLAAVGVVHWALVIFGILYTIGFHN